VAARAIPLLGEWPTTRGWIGTGLIWRVCISQAGSAFGADSSAEYGPQARTISTRFEASARLLPMNLTPQPRKRCRLLPPTWPVGNATAIWRSSPSKMGVAWCCVGADFRPMNSPRSMSRSKPRSAKARRFRWAVGTGLGMSFAGRCPPRCDVSDPKPGPETQPFVEGVHAGICSTALHQHVVAVSRPCMFQCSQYHGLAMTSAS
jgi:hypothetical protein